MLRTTCLSVLGLAWLLVPAAAQTTPAQKPARNLNFTAHPAEAGKKPAGTKATLIRRTDRLNNAVESDKGQSGYAAPGEPIEMPSAGGKNTATYDGQPAAKPKNTTPLAKPK